MRRFRLRARLASVTDDARNILDFASTFVDVDPALWRLVREDRVGGRTTVVSLPAKLPIRL